MTEDPAPKRTRKRKEAKKWPVVKPRAKRVMKAVVITDDTLGPPTKWRPEYVDQTRKLARLGAKPEEIAHFFDVHLSTFKVWLKDYPEMRDAMLRGRILADANVAESLYRRATGYEHEAVKVFADPKSGAELIVPYTEKFAPDVGAQQFWLRNRRPQDWSDKNRTEISGPDGKPLQTEAVVQFFLPENGRDK